MRANEKIVNPLTLFKKNEQYTFLIFSYIFLVFSIDIFEISELRTGIQNRDSSRDLTSIYLIFIYFSAWHRYEHFLGGGGWPFNGSVARKELKLFYRE